MSFVKISQHSKCKYVRVLIALEEYMWVCVWCQMYKPASNAYQSVRIGFNACAQCVIADVWTINVTLKWTFISVEFGDVCRWNSWRQIRFMLPFRRMNNNNTTIWAHKAVLYLIWPTNVRLIKGEREQAHGPYKNFGFWDDALNGIIFLLNCRRLHR